MAAPESKFTVTPASTKPEDVRAAELAQRILDSPAFLEEYEKNWREGLRAFIRGEYRF